MQQGRSRSSGCGGQADRLLRERRERLDRQLHPAARERLHGVLDLGQRRNDSEHDQHHAQLHAERRHDLHHRDGPGLAQRRHDDRERQAPHRWCRRDRWRDRGGHLDDQRGGAFSGQLVKVSNSAAFTGTLLQLLGDSTTSGKILGISGAGLTTGRAIDVTLAAQYTGTGAVNVSAGAFGPTGTSGGTIFNVSASSNAQNTTANLEQLSAPLTQGRLLYMNTSATAYNGTGALTLDLQGSGGTGAGILVTGNATYAGKLIDLQRGGTSLVAIDNSSGLVSTVQIQLSGNFTQTGATTFSTGTSTVTLNGPVTLAANVGVTAAAGTGGLDFSLASGTFKTGSGAVSLNGDTTVTGTKFFTANGATTLNGSLTLGSASLQGGVIVSSAAGVVSAVAPGTSGNVLTSNGTTWVSQAASGGGGNALFGSAVDGTGGNCGTLTAATVTLTRDIYCTSL